MATLQRPLQSQHFALYFLFLHKITIYFELFLYISNFFGYLLAMVPVPLPFVGPTKTILLVDDEVMLRESLKGVLRIKFQSQLVVFEAHSVAEAIRLLSNQPIDFVVCDLEMPGRNGLELLKWIKIAGKNPFFIFYSGAVSTLPPGTLDTTFLGFVQKPESKLLFDKIKEHLCLTSFL